MPHTSDIMLPLDGTIYSGATEEEVAVSGLLHIITQVTTTVVCSEVRLHARLVGGSGTGKTTGHRYVVGGAATVQHQIPLEPVSCPSFQVIFRVATSLEPAQPLEEGHSIALPVEIRTSADATGALKAESAEIVE